MGKAQTKGMYLSVALKQFQAAQQRVRGAIEKDKEHIVTVRCLGEGRGGWDVSIALPGQPSHYTKHLRSVTQLRNLGKIFWAFTFRRQEWYAPDEVSHESVQ